MRILLITPPMVQVNAPYPAMSYLAGSLKGAGHDVIQEDSSLALALTLFSRDGLKQIRKQLPVRCKSSSVSFFKRHFREYAQTIDLVVAFLQGRAPSLGVTLRSRQFLPEGPRFALLNEIEGHRLLTPLSAKDKAIYLASLYLDDLADVIHDGIDEQFELSRYGEKLAASAPCFDKLAFALRRKPTLVDKLLKSMARALVIQHKPDLIGFTLPFPGNVYGALRMAQTMKRMRPEMKIVMGGGVCQHGVATPLRSSPVRIHRFHCFG